jgi:ABC-type transport system substrate-binding protein
MRFRLPAAAAVLAAGVATTSPASRLAIYTQVLKRLAADVPYVPLYQDNAFLAITGKFTLPALGVDTFEIPWALNVRTAA